ncbi:MAG TPA: hypothetical protein DDW83_07220, partial [Peptococcaceae bacterium]|nr:hypothetical protein [Peptococcaceae bacterium]
CLDHPGLVSLALTLVADYQSENEDSIYLVPSSYRWEPQVEKLIKSLAGECLHFLSIEETVEAEQPVNTDPELEWLGAPEL